MNFYVVFGVLAALTLHAIAEESKEATPTSLTAAATTPSKVTTASDPNDKWTIIPYSYGTALAAGGAVVIGVVVLLAIAAVVSPLFGYKLCQIFSTCDAVTTSAAGYSGDAYNAGYASSPFPTYQKRSVEYVGPILKALHSAYEKYGHGENLLNNIQNVHEK